MLIISLFHSDLPCSRVLTLVKFSCTWKNAQSVLRVKTYTHTESYLQPTNIFFMKVVQFFFVSSCQQTCLPSSSQRAHGKPPCQQKTLTCWSNVG